MGLQTGRQVLNGGEGGFGRQPNQREFASQGKLVR